MSASAGLLDLKVLDAWVGRHGTLSAPASVTLALEICGRASHMSDAQLSETIASLEATHVARDAAGRWIWNPTASTDHSSTADDDVVERIGALLFFCLVGERLAYPLANDEALRARLRPLRPDLPSDVADLVIDAIGARRRRHASLDTFAARLRRALGADREIATRSRRLKVLAAAVAIPIAIAIGLLAFRPTPPRDQKLGRAELAETDAAQETGHGFLQMDEQSAAIQIYAGLARLWRRHLTPDDPRLAWLEVHQAWSQTLRGDRLTAEQALENKPTWLATQIGATHPYTRTARLALAATLEARGAATQAATLRRQVEQSTEDLARTLGVRFDTLDPQPVPAGVLAHLEPNAAEREGFRQSVDGGYFTPLTGTQRWMASKLGWRLHVVATGRCRMSIVAGRDPRVVTVEASRASTGGWRLEISGVRPPIAYDTIGDNADRSIGISLAGDPDGRITATAGAALPRVASVDIESVRPEPPHRLMFDSPADKTGCALVWLEIPFPTEQTFSRH